MASYPEIATQCLDIDLLDEVDAPPPSEFRPIHNNLAPPVNLLGSFCLLARPTVNATLANPVEFTPDDSQVPLEDSQFLGLVQHMVMFDTGIHNYEVVAQYLPQADCAGSR